MGRNQPQFHGDLERVSTAYVMNYEAFIMYQTPFSTQFDRLGIFTFQNVESKFI